MQCNRSLKSFVGVILYPITQGSNLLSSCDALSHHTPAKVTVAGEGRDGEVDCLFYVSNQKGHFTSPHVPIC